MTAVLAWVNNPAIEWLTARGGAGLAVDIFLVIGIIRGVERLWLTRAEHPVVRALRFLTLAAGIIVASAWVLSGFHLLGGGGFLGLHAIVAAGLWAVARRRKREPARMPGLGSVLFLRGDRRGPRQATTVERLLLPVVGWAVVLVLIYALVLAAGTFAVNYDSQTYRLPRIGYWLQEHRIAMDFANETRLWFMPINTELVMLWLTAFFPSGYPLVNLAQLFGGCIGVLATLELGRLAGLRRPARLFAVVVLVGMPNVFLQFSTSQSDLFTAGLLNAGLAFVWRALRRRSTAEAIWAGLAFGLAIGAKSSVVYWVPGLLLWVAVVLGRERAGWRGIRGLAIAAGVMVLVGGWKYADNVVRFGSPFAPPEDIARVHQHADAGSRGALAWFIAEFHGWQLVQANSNPRIAAPVLAPVERGLREHMEASAPTPELRQNFQAIRTQLGFEGNFVFEDIVSFGLLPCLLAVIGVARDLGRVRRDRFAGIRVAMVAALVVFFAFFFTQQNLNAWNYRFFVMLAPFLVVAGAAAWPVRSWRWSAGAALAVAGWQLGGAVDFQARNVLGGWRGLSRWNEVSEPFSSFVQLARELPPSVHTVALALPTNAWLSPWFRQPAGRRFRFVALEELRTSAGTAAEFLETRGFDAVITTPGRFAVGAGEGVEMRENGLPAAFAQMAYFRRR